MHRCVTMYAKILFVHYTCNQCFLALKCNNVLQCTIVHYPPQVLVKWIHTCKCYAKGFIHGYCKTWKVLKCLNNLEKVVCFNIVLCTTMFSYAYLVHVEEYMLDRTVRMIYTLFLQALLFKIRTQYSASMFHFFLSSCLSITCNKTYKGPDFVATSCDF